MSVTLPRLPYELDALEPVISAATLKVHYGEHHRGYVRKLNELIKGTDLDGNPLDVIVRRSAQFASPAAEAIFNNAAQAWNHTFFWHCLRPAGHGGEPQAELASRLRAEFGGEAQFAEAFKAQALRHFGAGWIWLVVEDGVLRITTTANADTPIAHGQSPLLVMDVWEHAYYLDYRSQRAGYVSGVLERLINWEFAERNYLFWTRPGVDAEAREEAFQ